MSHSCVLRLFVRKYASLKLSLGTLMQLMGMTYSKTASKKRDANTNTPYMQQQFSQVPLKPT